MNILLVNNNPVVEKLVTLSAAKIGASITCVDELQKIEQTSYDLLMVDDQIYSDEFFNTLDATITYKTSLYIDSKDSSFIDTFKYELKKPFLPTDLVELFTKIVSDLASAHDDLIQKIQDDENTKEEVSSDLTIQESDSLPELDDMHEDHEIKNFDTLELDDLHDLDEDTDKESSSILDEHDVQEVQQLLEGTDEEDESIMSDASEDDILDIKEIPLEIEDTDKDEQSQNEISDDILELQEIPEIDEINKDEEELEAEKDLDIEQITKVEEPLEIQETTELEELEENLSTEQNQEISHDDVNEEEVKQEDIPEINEGEEDLDAKQSTKIEESSKIQEAPELEEPEEDLLIEQNQEISHEDMNEAEIKQEDTVDKPIYDANVLIDNIEDNIQHEVSKLSDDDLNANITEDMLGDLDELSLIDEDTLKMAIGEEDTVATAVNEMPQQKNLDTQDTQKEEHNGTKALKALLKALDDDDVIASLDGMNISISINIGQK